MPFLEESYRNRISKSDSNSKGIGNSNLLFFYFGGIGLVLQTKITYGDLKRPEKIGYLLFINKVPAVFLLKMH